MENLVDLFCWEEHRKILTCRESGIPALQTFGICSNNRAGQPLHVHTHNGCMEIVFVVKGIQVYEAGGEVYNLTGSDIFVSYTGEPHSSGSYPENVCDLIWMQIRMEKGIPFFGLDESHAVYLRESLLALPRFFSGDAALRSMLTEAFFGLAEKSEMDRYMAEQKLVYCLFRIVQLSQKMIPRRTDCIEDAIAFIHANLGNPILLEEAADSCGLSLSRFKVKFKEEIGVTPREYINRVKIEKSKRLLEENCSVTDTALNLGFSTPNYFAVSFKKYTGLTPREYQERIRESDAERKEQSCQKAQKN